jgi:hypothetical protein
MHVGSVIAVHFAKITQQHIEIKNRDQT